jgi:transglutaminase-like putative cysteine protease
MSGCPGRWRAAALALVLCLPVGWRDAGSVRAAQADPSAWKTEQELWYVMELAGARAGWAWTRIESDGDRWRTGTGTKLSVSRGAAAVTIEMTSTIVETLDGRPELLRSVQDLGLQALELEYRFGDGGVTLVSRQGGREHAQPVPVPPEPWLTPMAIRRHWMASRARGATEIAYRTIDPAGGLRPIEITLRFLRQETADVEGRAVPVTVWESTNTALPGRGTDTYTAEGDLVVQEMELPGLGRVVMRRAAREAATGAIEAPEILVATFVAPDRPIPRADDCTRATLRLRARKGDLPPLPSAGAQRVALADGAATLAIDIDDNLPAAPGDAEDPAYREPSPMVQSDDPLVKKLAGSAVRGAGPGALDRADALRAFVHRLISSKGLDTAFATAGETARTRTGDCSEHAVLLCAMLRAQGIPARVGVGLVYADSFLDHRDIFGWHLWTQALIDGRWVDLDATLPRRYHAAHVLAATSALGEGGIDVEIAPILLLLGNLEIEVVDVGHD